MQFYLFVGKESQISFFQPFLAILPFFNFHATFFEKFYYKKLDFDENKAQVQYRQQIEFI
jgi:hypothetical protein